MMKKFNILIVFIIVSGKATAGSLLFNIDMDSNNIKTINYIVEDNNYNLRATINSKKYWYLSQSYKFSKLLGTVVSSKYYNSQMLQSVAFTKVNPYIMLENSDNIILGLSYYRRW